MIITKAKVFSPVILELTNAEVTLLNLAMKRTYTDSNIIIFVDETELNNVWDTTAAVYVDTDNIRLRNFCADLSDAFAGGV